MHVSKQRIGIYGGTFDPIHLGHLQVAEAIVENFCLDRLYFVPAFVPPHKRNQQISSPFHRMSMLVLATADHARLYVSTIELESPDRPYTIDTLERFQMEFGDARLFFVMGADSFRDITMWRRHEEILRNFDNIVAGRPGAFSTSNLREIVAHLAQDLHTKLIDLRGQKRLGIKTESNADGIVPGCSANEIPASPSIYLTDYVSVDVSATNLREAVARDESIAGQVPDAVAAYIRKYGLYLSTK